MGGNYDIWKHFTKIGPDKNFKQGCAQYNYCNHKCNKLVVSCKGHLKVCEHANLETKQQYFGPTFQETISKIIQDNEFWNEVQNLLVILKVLAEIAYLMDSRFQGKTLTNENMSTVSNFVEKYYPET
ncbi:22347_t:CDS:2, partial [Gigaspora margarita]